MTPALLADLVRAAASDVLADAAWTSRRSPTTSASSGRATPSTATTPRNVALQLAQEGRRQPRASWPDGSPRRWPRSRRHRARRGRRARASSTCASRPRRAGRHRRQRHRRRARPTATATSSPAATINLEFVSANPTGPIHIGGTRWAAVGDALGRLLDHPGRRGRPRVLLQRPRRPDRPVRPLAGRRGQGRAHARGRLRAAPTSATSPRRCSQQAPDALSLPDDQQHEIFRAIGVDLMFDRHQGSRCTTFGTDFDVYFHEESLHESGAVEAAIERLKASATSTRRTAQRGCAPPTTATTRTASSSRATASPPTSPATSPTTSTSAQRGFDLCIYMLGADHHGYIARLKAVAAALGDDPAVVEVLIGQMVNLVRDGQPVRMSKRAGTVITLDDLVEAIGVDAARYALIRSSVDIADRHRPRPVVVGAATTTRSTTCNTRTPGCRRWPATPPSSASSPDTGHLELLTHDKEGDADPQRSASSRAVRRRRRPTLREPHRVAATSRTWPATTTGSTTPAGCCRRATRSPPSCTRARLALCAGDPAGASPTGWRCSASPRRSGCERPSRPGPRHAEEHRTTPARPPRAADRRAGAA